MFKVFPPHAVDFYKPGHARQYVDDLEKMYSNFTPRGDKHFNGLSDFDHKIVFFGLQGVIQWMLIDWWNREFFSQDKDYCVKKFKRRMDRSLGKNKVTGKEIADLHDVGYLPFCIKALPEGSRVDMRVPPFTFTATDDRFAWLTNYLETQISAETWKAITSATTAYEYRRLFEKYAEETGIDKSFVDFQGHDFSLRGMCGIEDGTMSGAAHLISFKGTDTVSSIDYLEDYYFPDENDGIGFSIPASEHSVASLNILKIRKELEESGLFRDDDLLEESEYLFLKNFITNTYPSGFCSYVSDTYDLFKVITTIAQKLKYVILNRDGKLVFRPDSGNPVDIICGIEVMKFPKCNTLDEAKDWALEWIIEKVQEETEHGYCGPSYVIDYFEFGGKTYRIKVSIKWNRYDKRFYYMDGYDLISCEETILTAEQKGAVECLWDTFGGTLTTKGYKTLDSHVGLIYGDSISLKTAAEILRRLKAKGFSSANIVFGIGSFTYQMVTRDTLGTAIKATHAVVKGEPIDLYKDPKTDSGMKKSAKGLLRVEYENGHYVLYDQQTKEQEKQGLLETVFENGKLVKKQTLTEIRERLLTKEGVYVS